MKYKLSRVVSQSRFRHIYINGLIALKILVVILRYRSHKACRVRTVGQGGSRTERCVWFVLL